MRKSSLLASLAVLLACGLLGMIVAGKPPAVLLRQPLVQAALQPIGVAETSWQTMILFAARDVELSRDALWRTWERLEEWPRWAPHVVEAKWLDQTPGWRVDARFEQVLNLGLAFRRYRSAERVGSARPGEMVGWWKDENGIRSNHVWAFEDLPGGGTRVTSLEVFHGPLIGILRPFVEHDWQGRFDAAIDGLVLAARRSP